MSIEAESINSMSEPNTIGMGPQNPCGVSFRSHSGKNTEEYSLKFSIYLLKTIKLNVNIGIRDAGQRYITAILALDFE